MRSRRPARSPRGHTGRSKSGPSGLVGTVVAPPTAMTPGSADKLLEQRAVVRARFLAAVVRLAVEKDRRHQHAARIEPGIGARAGAGSFEPAALSPSSAPRAIATWATTMPSRSQWRSVAFGRAQRCRTRGRRAAPPACARQACGSPDRIAESAVTAAMKSERAVVERHFVEPRQVGRQRGQHAQSRPRRSPRRRRRPAAASSADSSRNSRSSRADEAPSARRTAVSCRRSSPRISESSATLAQATSSTSPTAASRIQSTFAASPTVSSASGESCTPQPRLVAGYSSPSSRATRVQHAPRPVRARRRASVARSRRDNADRAADSPEMFHGIQSCTSRSGMANPSGITPTTLKRPPLEHDRAADDARIAAEALRPHAVRQHHDRVGADRRRRGVEVGAPRLVLA